MRNQSTNIDEAETLALSALGWTLSDGDRAARFLALTGLSPEDLRERIDERSLLGATLAFLEAHEPDLLACAEALNVAPARLVEARSVLEREGPHQSITLVGNP